MNYVGQLAETVFVTVKELYRGLNPATLTGGIDVIVVRQPDGSLQCSPFHVRFGKLGVLRSKEKVVDIEINGEPVNLHMKLGDNGEAFFVEENEDFETTVPAHLCTSPIPTDVSEALEVSECQSGASCSSNRRKKRRRKRARSDTHQREEASSSSDERESLEQDTHKEESLLAASVFYSRPSSPKSDSELCKSQESLGPQMQWNWGAFPKVCQTEKPESDLLIDDLQSPTSSYDQFHFRTIHRQTSVDMDTTDSVTVVRPEPHIATTSPLSLDKVLSSSVNTGVDVNISEACQSLDEFSPQTWAGLENKEIIYKPVNNGETNNSASCLNMISDNSRVNNGDFDTVTQRESSTDDNIVLEMENITLGAVEFKPDSKPELEINSTDQILILPKIKKICFEHITNDTGKSEEEGHLDTLPTNQDVDMTRLTSSMESGVKSDDLMVSELSKGVDSQDKKKVKRSQHLGPSDIYLDDLSTLDPESLGSINADSGTEYLSDSTTDSLDVTMSLCGRGDISQISKEKFLEHLVKFQDLVNNPGIIEDPNLVICINSKYYNWAVAAPMILSVQAFQKTLPKSTIEQLMKDKMPKKSGRWWFSWRRKELNNIERNPKPGAEENPLEASSSVTEASGLKASVELSSDEETSVSMMKNSDVQNTSQCITQIYRKSLRLTSEQIESLNLREGANQVVFSVTTQYQGTCRCEATIFLWNYDDRIIISDIDGTITKSDALGHILPQFGKDWTHHGIAKLYHKIHQNGYKFLYCSARAIGMADITKGYLQWVNDRGTVLPKGPVLLAPSSLFSALHREVIEKKPEVFKIACLTDIRDLFGPVRHPFYAAFGNRTNDVYAYKEVGVPETHIFTVNPKGELIQEKIKGNKSSYSHLSELVDHFFPFISKLPNSSFDCPEFSHFSFWRVPLPPLDLQELS
ncbi:hypothetical protein DNTS_007610 [Danionella cerebrum]|uniref:phosphatidate phosphatase n=1 Tax=Danionella cerebrum TaxID=2873325 RepID=A0A553MZK4_9TELE|nr:hypothetical protein DNTS_007610 [Danionella translucida]